MDSRRTGQGAEVSYREKGVKLAALTWVFLSVTLVQQGRVLLAILYVLASVLGGLLAVWLGISLATFRA